MGIEDMLNRSKSLKNPKFAGKEIASEPPVAAGLAFVETGAGQGGSPRAAVRLPTGEIIELREGEDIERLISIDDIRPDVKNYADRRPKRDDDMEGLMLSLRQTGLEQAIQIREDPEWPKSDSRYIIIQGERRWTAHKWLRDDLADEAPIESKKFSEIRAKIFVGKTDAWTLFKKQHAENKFRVDVPLLKEVRAYKEHFDRLKKETPEITQADLATQLGLTNDEMSRCLSVASAHKVVHTLIERYKMEIDDASLLIRIWNHTIGEGVANPKEAKVEKIKKIAERRAAGELTRDDLRKMSGESKKSGNVNPDTKSLRQDLKPYFTVGEDKFEMRASKVKLTESFDSEPIRQFASELVKLVERFVQQYPDVRPALEEAMKEKLGAPNL